MFEDIFASTLSRGQSEIPQRESNLLLQPALSNRPTTFNKDPFEKFDAVEGIGNLDAETTTEEPGVSHIVLKRPETTVEQGYALQGAYTEAKAKQFNSSDGKTSIYDMHVTAVEEMRNNEEKDSAEAETESKGRDCAEKNKYTHIPKLESTATKKLFLPASKVKGTVHLVVHMR